MKIFEFLASLSWLLLPIAFAKLHEPFLQMPSLSINHPDRIMEQRGQLDCLGHNFMDLDILRRFESHLAAYPEVRVGCETMSLKPFKASSQPTAEPEGPWDWVFNNNHNNDQQDYKVPPRQPGELEDKLQKYFVIDMSGEELQVQPGTSVTVETYDLSQVYVSKYDSTPGPLVSDLSTRLQTFTFEQLCFPSECYSPGDKKAEECRTEIEWLSPNEAGSFLVQCAAPPDDECKFMMGYTSDLRRSQIGKSGSVLAPNISTYCSVGTWLGPLRTPDYPGFPSLFSVSSSPRRSQVPSDTLRDPDDEDMRKSKFLTPILLSAHFRTDKYEDQFFITSCIVYVPLQSPYNSSFAVDFFLKRDIAGYEYPIRPGQKLNLKFDTWKEYVTDTGGRGHKRHDVSYEVKFEDLCFPAECFEEPPPADEVKCQFQNPKACRGRDQVPGAVLTFTDPSRSIDKILWPTKNYYNKFLL